MLAQKALRSLNGNIDIYEFHVKYSRSFSDYNANVRKSSNRLSFHLSSTWKGVSDEIVIGLMQGLMIRILKLPKQQTLNMDLYDTFIRNLQKTSTNVSAAPALQESFIRLNDKFFEGRLDLPNMVWGQNSKRKLASYDHHNDTVTVSSAFQSAPVHLLDFLVYHELLHKKLQYRCAGSRTLHHGKQFRDLENNYGDIQNLDREIVKFLRYW